MDITKYKFFKDLTTLPFIEEIWLYGSRVRGDNQERADIDLAVTCPQASSEDWLRVLDILDNADTLLKIDCVRFDALEDSSDLKLSINRQGVKLYVRI